MRQWFHLPRRVPLTCVATLFLIFLVISLQTRPIYDVELEQSDATSRPVINVNRLRASIGHPLRYTGKLRDSRLLNATSPVWDANYFALYRGASAGVNYGDEEVLRPGLTPSERSTLQEFLLHFATIAESAGVTYFLHAGTLLGAIRHHGIIPWDDEVDVYVNYTQRYWLKAALEQQLSPSLRLDISDYNWKVCSRNKSNINERHPWSFPFLDIAFFTNDDEHMWEMYSNKAVRKYAMKNVFRLSGTVFPLVRRPFLNLWLPTPRSPVDYLTIMYKEISCRNHGASHRLESSLNMHITHYACDSLHNIYPFVNPKEQIESGNELLVLNNTVLQWVYIDY